MLTAELVPQYQQFAGDVAMGLDQRIRQLADRLQIALPASRAMAKKLRIRSSTLAPKTAVNRQMVPPATASGQPS